MSNRLAYKARPLFHESSSFFGGHGVDIHGVRVFLALVKIKPSRSFLSLLVSVGGEISSSILCLRTLHNCALHAQEVVLQFDCPFVPFIEVSGRC